ncbi:ribosomal biogenesis regulatory protein [Dipodascopsis uninucleata]
MADSEILAVNMRSVTVEKAVPMTYDLGNLAIFDSNTLDADQLGQSETIKEEYLKSVARDSAQLLINQILALPVVSGGRTGASHDGNESVYAQLPDPLTQLPREKPVPTVKPLTKWEKFAKQKGIRPKARNAGNLTYDEASGEWVKKWGYKGKNQEEPWLVEVNESGEVVEDGDSLSKNKKRKSRK